MPTSTFDFSGAVGTNLASAGGVGTNATNLNDLIGYAVPIGSHAGFSIYGVTGSSGPLADIVSSTNSVLGRVAGNVVFSTIVNSQIADSTISTTKLANAPATTLLGNNTGSPAVPSYLTPSQVRSLLGLAGVATSGAASDVTGLAAIATSGSADDLIAGHLPAARFPVLLGDLTNSIGNLTITIVSNAVTGAKFRQSDGLSVVGNPTGSPTNVVDITASGSNQFLRTRAGVLGFGSILSTDIPALNYENPLTFTSGLSRSTNVITNDVITGHAGNQIWTGSTDVAGTLRIRATSDATKGSITAEATNLVLDGGGVSGGFAIGTGTPFASMVYDATNSATVIQSTNNLVEFRNGTGLHRQALHVYNRFNSGTDYERVTLGFDFATDAFRIAPQWAGTGVAKELRLGMGGTDFLVMFTSGEVAFGNNVEVFGDVTTSGNLTVAQDLAVTGIATVAALHSPVITLPGSSSVWTLNALDIDIGASNIVRVMNGTSLDVTGGFNCSLDMDLGGTLHLNPALVAANGTGGTVTLPNFGGTGRPAGGTPAGWWPVQVGGNTRFIPLYGP